MKKKMRIVLTVVGTAALIAAVAALVSLCTVDTRIYTTTSGMIGTNGYTYLVSPLFRFKIGWKEEDRKAAEAWEDNSLKSAQLAVAAVDPALFRDKYADLDRQIFAVDGKIYYYRENVFDGFFCLDVATETVTKRGFSEYSQYVHVPDEEKATADHIGMHNFIMGNSILAEGIMDSYPGFCVNLQAERLPYYAPWTFYDAQSGRIFFAAENSMVYEYLPLKDAIRKVAKVGRGDTVQMIRTK